MGQVYSSIDIDMLDAELVKGCSATHTGHCQLATLGKKYVLLLHNIADSVKGCSCYKYYASSGGSKNWKFVINNFKRVLKLIIYVHRG